MTTMTLSDPAGALLALEARKALLSGAVAALAAPDDLAAGLFESALADPAARRWPFDLARVHLLYGERLRQCRETARSRHHLQTALTAFETLSAPGWADRAAAELAAVTQEVQPGQAGPAPRLAAPELRVAELAAAGLTNKEIARQLYMSHRTVAAYLYRIFPKLGISSRAGLRDALSRSEPRQ
jgi:DNA-binding CsgD family transcriptional regulator